MKSGRGSCKSIMTLGALAALAAAIALLCGFNPPELIWQGDHKLYVALGDDAARPVYLQGLPAFTWVSEDGRLSGQAILLRTVLDAACGADARLKGYRYDMVGTDGYSLLRNTLEGDVLQLPAYDALNRGWLVEYYDAYAERADLVVLWDDELGFSNSYKVRTMDRGVLRGFEPRRFGGRAALAVGWGGSELLTHVPLAELPAETIAGKSAVRLHHVVRAAEPRGFDPKKRQYGLNIVGPGGADLLRDALQNRLLGLPVWDRKAKLNIHQAYVYECETDRLCLGWDRADGAPAGFDPGPLDNGRIELFDITP